MADIFTTLSSSIAAILAVVLIHYIATVALLWVSVTRFVLDYRGASLPRCAVCGLLIVICSPFAMLIGSSLPLVGRIVGLGLTYAAIWKIVGANLSLGGKAKLVIPGVCGAIALLAWYVALLAGAAGLQRDIQVHKAIAVAHREAIKANIPRDLAENHEYFDSLVACAEVRSYRPSDIMTGIPTGDAAQITGDIDKDGISRSHLYIYVPALHEIHHLRTSDLFTDGLAVSGKYGVGAKMIKMSPDEAARKIVEQLPPREHLIRALYLGVDPLPETLPSGAELGELYIAMAERKWTARDFGGSVGAARHARTIITQALGPDDPKVDQVQTMIDAAFAQLNSNQ